MRPGSISVHYFVLNIGPLDATAWSQTWLNTGYPEMCFYFISKKSYILNFQDKSGISQSSLY